MYSDIISPRVSGHIIIELPTELLLDHGGNEGNISMSKPFLYGSSYYKNYRTSSCICWIYQDQAYLSTHNLGLGLVFVLPLFYFYGL